MGEELIPELADGKRSELGGHGGRKRLNSRARRNRGR